MQASVPIQTHMGLTVSRDVQQRDVAKLLPNPLYVLFSQAYAFKSVQSKIPIIFYVSFIIFKIYINLKNQDLILAC